jgi:hypothetical protein
MIPAHWLLADHVSSMAVLSCDDPAESLARHAALLGEVVIELLAVDLDEDNGDELMQVFLAGTIAHEARSACRFAAAALALVDSEDTP